jgi:hypothetical protein
MPIGFDPNDTCLVTLDCLDQGKPDAERARFKCRFLTSGQRKRVEALVQQAYQPQATDAERDALINQALLLGIVGWENLRDSDGKDVPFGPEALDEFTFRAKSAMASEYPVRVSISEGDRKN